MSIAYTASSHDLIMDNRGPFKTIATLTVTGMTGGATNTVAHGRPTTPRRVWFTAIGSSNTANCSLNTSTAAAGFDATNVYVDTPSGVTTVQMHVEC